MYLFELRDRVLMLPTLESRMALLLKEIQKAEDDVSSLLRQYEKKSRNVERLQKESLSSFLLKLIGKYEDKLDKGQRGEINTKFAYDRATTHLDTLMREKDELSSRISALRAEEQTYQVELTNRRRELAIQLTEQEGIRYAELGNERNTIISQITEIREALSVAARAKSTAQSALESLKGAASWATYDVFTSGGIISHIAKYSHIDSAEQNFHTLSSQLRDLQSELNDVHGLTVSGLNEISSTQRAIDFWLDNIFTDLSVRRQIKDNTEQISRLLRNINTVESALKAKLKEEESKFAKNRRCEEELLLSIR